MLALALVGCASPVPTPSASTGPTATPTPTASPSASRRTAVPTVSPPPTPTPTPRPPADLVGRWRGFWLDDCSDWLVDAAGERWQIDWPAGYAADFEAEGTEAPVLIDGSGEIIARAGDTVGLLGEEVGSAPADCATDRRFVATGISFIEPPAAASEGPLLVSWSLPDQSYAVGDRTFALTGRRAITVGPPDFSGWEVLDEQTLALTEWRDDRSTTGWPISRRGIFTSWSTRPLYAMSAPTDC